MGERTSVNQDHALWYEFNESGQSTAVKSGLNRGPPGRAGKDDNQEKQLRGQDCEARLAPKLEPGEYSSNSSDMEIRGHHYRAATVETLIGRG